MIAMDFATGTVRISILMRPIQYSVESTASKVEGAPFAEYITTGNVGRFLGFLACLIQASYTIAGPEYVAMTAGEVASKIKFASQSKFPSEIMIGPRKTMPYAFRSVFTRLKIGRAHV